LRTSKWYENKIKETVPLNSSADWTLDWLLL
jgi:hypothetical protein